MIKTYKILAIGVIILFIGLSMSPATATKAKENETVSIEFGILNRDNSILKERLVLSQQEFAALQTKLSAATASQHHPSCRYPLKPLPDGYDRCLFLLCSRTRPVLVYYTITELL